jgi:hypothetical protein
MEVNKRKKKAKLLGLEHSVDSWVPFPISYKHRETLGVVETNYLDQSEPYSRMICTDDGPETALTIRQKA